jgi:hypothetical protein
LKFSVEFWITESGKDHSREGAKHAKDKQNPKFEYRNPKQTQRLKSQLRKPKRAGLEFSDF